MKITYMLLHKNNADIKKNQKERSTDCLHVVLKLKLDRFKLWLVFALTWLKRSHGYDAINDIQVNAYY